MSKNLTFFTPQQSKSEGAILIDTGISAGFPSHDQDIEGERVSLDDTLITVSYTHLTLPTKA